MYLILSEGAIVDYCDEPRYVKKNPTSGAYIQTDAANAEGIAVRGTLYNIGDRTDIPDAPAAIIRGDVSTPDYIFINKETIDKNKEESDAALIELENSLCDMDMSTQETIAALEDTICELDIMIMEVAENG